MRTLLLTIAFLCSSCAWTFAQTVCEANCSVAANRSVTVYTDVDPLARGYRLRVNGAIVDIHWVLVDGRVEFAIPFGMAAGAYAFAIEAIDRWTTARNTLTVAAVGSYRCTVPAKTSGYSNGDRKVTLRCPRGTPIDKGDTVTVLR